MYKIFNVNDDNEANEELGTSEHIGAKAIRRHIISSIRGMIEQGDVKITVSNKETYTDFIVKGE